MLKRIVLWTVQGDTEDQIASNAQRIKSLLESMRGQIPGMEHLEVGVNIGVSQDHCHIAFTTEFTDLQSLQEYDQHPNHLKIKDEVARLRKDRYVVVYET